MMHIATGKPPGVCQLRRHTLQCQCNHVLMRCVMAGFTLQALDWLHAYGWAHCDINLANMRVIVDEESGAFKALKLVDFESSVKFKGKLCQH